MARALGRYELLRPLARGGMAEIFLARRRAGGIEKLLVVKRIRAERAGDARFLELFVREARLSMSLAHQNIVPVFDFGRTGDEVFIAMERVEGRDLGGTLARPGVPPLPPVVAAFIAAECCQALDYAHGRKRDDGADLGVVHRDVTPRNVLVSWSGEVKLTDFGIAALAGEETSRLIGTPAYMAPEQARGEPVDARADLYAAGLVLREALTGARARPGADRDALVAAARRGELAPWPPGVPEQLVRITDRATAADPAARYPDARSMFAALDAFIVAERAAAPGEPPARRLAAWLAAAWAGARDDDASTSGERERPELLSLVDDAAAGTGTERSLAETADEPEPEPVPAGAPATAPAAPIAPTAAPAAPIAPAAPAASASASASASAPALTASASASAPALTASASAPALTASAAPVAPVAPVAPDDARPIVRRLAWLAPLALAAILGAVLASRRCGTAGDHAPARAADAALALAEAAPLSADAAALSADAAALSADAAPVFADAAPVFADAAPLSADAAPLSADAAPDRPRPPPADAAPAHALPPLALDAAPSDAPRDAARATRKVRVNARPWATFTVDGGTTSYETISTIELGPGPHRLHFSNPQLGVERDVTIHVPADRDLDHVEDLRR